MEESIDNQKKQHRRATFLHPRASNLQSNLNSKDYEDKKTDDKEPDADDSGCSDECLRKRTEGIPRRFAKSIPEERTRRF